MDERERLMKLISDMPKEQIVPELADYLLANGIIVPPVKVGDVVYIVCCVDNKTVIEESAVEEVSTKRIWTGEVDYDLEQIGKSIFLSRELAEQALAERKELDNG